MTAAEITILPSARLPRLTRWIAFAVMLVLLCAASPIHAQQSDSGADADDEGTTEVDPIRIPTALPDGRPLRRIGMYQSQQASLIPDDYVAVTLQRFGLAIKRLTDRATDDQASRLKSAVYWVEIDGDQLISERSVIDIESDRPSLVRRSLGRVNLAIEQSQHRSGYPPGAVLPRLESERDGNLVAVFRGDAPVRSGIEFKWRLRGQVSGSGYEFTMELPRTPQTRIVLSAPVDLSIETLDGVLHRRPGPPPDASEFELQRELRWYELDAGGLSTVRIRTRQERADEAVANFVVRRRSMQYEVDSAGLVWTSRIVAHAPPDREFPAIAVRGTTITSVEVSGIKASFTSKPLGSRASQIQIDVPGHARRPTGNQESSAADDRADGRPAELGVSTAVKITLTGYTGWSSMSEDRGARSKAAGRNTWCDLPIPVWVGPGIVQASPLDDVQIAVDDPLELITWQLPAQWKQSQPQLVDQRVMLYAAEGPAVMSPDTPKSAKPDTAKPSAAKPSAAKPIGAITLPPRWSRIRLVHRPMLKSSRTLLRLDPAPGSLVARARITLGIDPQRIEPLRLQLERGWSLDTVSFVKSGRVIENPSTENNTRLVLWPELEDADESEISIEVTGTKLLPASSALVVPATWFVRPVGVRGEMIAAIAPPPELNWSGEAVMQRGRIEPSDVSESQLELFSGLDQGSLWFRPETGRTPRLSMQTPSVSFNVRTMLRLGRDRDELIEHLEVEIESEGQNLRQISVHTGPSRGRPDLIWSISGMQGAPSTSLPSSDVITNETDGVYDIDVSDHNLRGRQLIARRRYRIVDSLELQLPSVPSAGSQNSEVVVGPALQARPTSSAVQMVPFEHDDPDISVPTTDRSLSHRQGELTRLRYDAVQQPSIEVSRSDVNPNVTIVWREQVRVVASSRGVDRVEALLKVSASAPLEIDYDPELQLASISRDGKTVDLIDVAQHPRIVLKPRFETEWIRIVWNRSQYGSSWMRRCRIPRINVSATVLKSDYELIASPDTFAPAALFRGRAVGVGRVSAIEMRPGDTTTLIRRNVSLAIGWLCTLLVFAVGWYVSDRAPLITAAAVVLMTALLVLWWPWKLAVIGWLIVPLVAAAMFSTSKAWLQRGGTLRKVDRSDSGGSSRSVVEDLSGDFTLDAVARFMLLLAMLGITANTSIALAQDLPVSTRLTQSEGEVDDAKRPASILVPLKKDGSMYGEAIYIPRRLHRELFPVTQAFTPQDARIESAEYTVRIDPSITRTDLIATVEAEYWIHVEDGERSTNLVRLPLPAASVRRIELMDEVTRIIQFQPDRQGEVVASLPAGATFRIRVTMLPQVEDLVHWTRLSLSVPAVAASHLSVESEQSIDTLRVGGEQGRILEETDLRRWEAELGPQILLIIDYRTLAAANAVNSQPMGRRYWVHAGKRQATIDCEVVPPRPISMGEKFQFVIRDSAIPNVVSPAWRLDRSEPYSATRQLITVTRTGESPGPIQLLWTQPLPLDDAEAEVTIRIPEVIAAALGETAPAWLALHCDSELQFAPIGRETNESLSVDDFLAAWTGYNGGIDSAYVSMEQIPDPVVRMKPVTPPAVSQRHHLHVTRDRLELYYTASLTVSDNARSGYTLRLPRGLELVRLAVDGTDLDSQPIRSGAFSQVPLGSFGDAESIEIRAVAIQRLAENKQFTPPHFAILPSEPTTGDYSISRDRATSLREVQPSSVEPVTSDQVATADSLAQGWIPVAAWAGPEVMPGATQPAPNGVYKVNLRPTRFDAQQLIILSHQDGEWSMETAVNFRSNQIPDFVDIELPTRWCESLDIGPTPAWSQQPASDPSRQIIRVPCDAEQLKNKMLSIRGKLDPDELDRISVPSVRVLGAGGRRIHISVPTRLENADQIKWRTSAVEAVALPAPWRKSISGSGRSTYLVASPSWSIDLAPLTEMDSQPVAVTGDFQVFAEDDGAVVVCHWDLSPGALESVDIQLPPASKCLGAWTAGRAVAFEMRDDVTESSGNGQQNVVRVPLSLSRISQPVEVLIRVDSSSAKSGRYLPELLGVPVTEKWLTNYTAANSPEVRGDERARGQRALALARSVIDSIDAVESVDRRPRDEVAAWLQFWLARYRMIAASDGHVVDLSDPDLDIPQVSVSNANLQAWLQPSPSLAEWMELDSRMASYANRFLAHQRTSADQGDSGAQIEIEDTTVSGAVLDAGEDMEGFHFPVADFDGFVADHVTRLSASIRPRPVNFASTDDRWLRDLITNVLTLLLVFGVLMSVRPWQRYAIPVVTHPAFWLALMGVFGFAVAPVAVAAAIVLVAVSLPAFPSKQVAAGRSRN